MESERSLRFDFLINGVYLQDTLDKHLTKYNLSTVSKPMSYNNFSYEFVICISPIQHHNFLLSIYIITFVYIVFPFTYFLPLQESVVEIEYVEKHPTPRPDNFLLHDDWVSSVSVSENWYVQ